VHSSAAESSASLSFDVEEANDRYLADSRRDPEEAAERVLDRQWARVVTENALERIRDGFGADQVTYERLRFFLIPGGEPGTYEAAAKDLGVSLDAPQERYSPATARISRRRTRRSGVDRLRAARDRR